MSEVFDVRIGRRYIGFRLVVIVKTDENTPRRCRESSLEFLKELGGEGLVMGNDQRRELQALNDIGHCNVLPEPVTPRSV